MMLPDVQASADPRHIAIDRVGVKSVHYPVTILGADNQAKPSIGFFDLYVALSAEVKGTHMSRFIELLDSQLEPLSIASMRSLLDVMLGRLEAQGGSIHVKAPFFVHKKAPVSGVGSLMDYEVSWDARRDQGTQTTSVVQTVQVPVKSLCPCSKEISDYGAHNQRSHVTISAELAENSTLSLEEQIRFAEDNASCELWGLLKRPDEKYVTERAYDNPKFVEDMVRDVAVSLNQDARIVAYKVTSENFESIHNHSAFACIEHRKKMMANCEKKLLK